VSDGGDAPPKEEPVKTILHTVQIHASPARVYECLTTERGLGGWWTSQVSVESGQGGLIRFTFHGDFHPHMKQTRLERDRLVEWLCVAGHPNWSDNTFRFRLDGKESDTQLRFVQEYAQELSDDVYGTYNFNWGYYLNSLKQLAESGTGAPFRAPA
jgi:uncharacterized protein YndB with AHSA1/START domain